MRTAYRVLTTAFAVGALFPIGTFPVHADEAPLSVETSSWFWSAQTTGQTVNGAPVPTLPLGPSGVTDAQLAVAYKGESETLENGDKRAKSDKETFLAWDTSFTEGAYIDSFTFTIALDTAAEQLYEPNPITVPSQPQHGGVPGLIACFPTIGFGQGAGESYSAKPDLDCTDPMIGSYDDATKSYTFDATVQAQDWADGKDNYGIGIRPLLDQQDPFQLVFLGAKDVKATIAYTPAEPEAPVVVTQPDVVLPPVPPTDTSVLVPETQPLPQPQPQVQPAPVVASQPPVVQMQPVAATPLKASRGFTPVFWFAMIGGVLLIGTASMILGDPVEAAGRSRNRISPNGRHRLNVPAGAPARVNPAAQPRIV